MTSVLKKFLELVVIDSPSGKEESVREYLVNWADSHGCTCRVDTTGNLLITTPGKSDLPFFLCAHMDTVEPGRGIKPQVQKGIVRSDGSTILGADNKAALAAMLTALEDWLPSSQHRVQLLCTVREETGGGADFFDPSWLTTQTGYIFDAAQPLGIVVSAAPFITNFAIHLQGKASHSSKPENGQNPLPALATLLQRITLGKLSANTFVNIGKIQAGSGINTVPELVFLEGEVRSFSEEEFQAKLQEIQELAESLSPQIKATFRTSGYCAGYVHDDQASAFDRLTQALQLVGCQVRRLRSSGISDANSLNALGLTVITASDGVRDPHTTAESMAVADLEKLYNMVTHLLMSA